MMDTKLYMQHARFLESTEDTLNDMSKLGKESGLYSNTRGSTSYVDALNAALDAVRKARVNATAEALIAYQNETRQYAFDITPARYPGDPKGESYC